MKGIFLAFVWGTTLSWGATDRLGIDFDAECKKLLVNTPTAVLLHDPAIANYALDQIAELHRRIQETLTRSQASTFAIHRGYWAPFGELFPHTSMTRMQMQALDRALLSLRWLIYFESDFSAKYTEWTSGVDFRSDEHRTYMELLQYKPPEKASPELKNRYAARSPEKWGQYEARRVYYSIQEDALRKWGLVSRSRNAMDRSRLEAGRESMEQHHLLPEFFQSWLRGHSEIADHYRLERTVLYYETLEALDDVYLETAGTF